MNMRYKLGVWAILLVTVFGGVPMLMADEKGGRQETITYLTGVSSGNYLGEPNKNLPAAFSYIIRPLELKDEDNAVIFFPGVRGRGLPMKRESSYFAKRYECMMPVAVAPADSTAAALEQLGFAVLVLELDPDDPEYSSTKLSDNLLGWVEVLIAAVLSREIPITPGQGDKAIEAFKDHIRGSFVGRKHEHDPIGAVMWLPEGGSDRNERSKYLFDVNANANANTEKSRGSVTAQTRLVTPRTDIEWIEATIDTVTIDPKSGRGERGKNKNVEVFVHSRFAVQITDLLMPPNRFPVSGTKDTKWDGGTVKIGTPFWFSPSGNTRWEIPADKAVSFIYLEATVWDADATAAKDSDDLLGILSHTVFADELEQDGADEWSKKFTRKVGSRAMDTRKRDWKFLFRRKLKMVGGGQVTISYSLRVKFR